MKQIWDEFVLTITISFVSTIIILAIAGALLLIALAVGGCSTDRGDVRYSLELAQHVDPRFNWSQEALKRQDYGCPSAIYIAPDGVLTQCAP
jgi:hypothetical protein